MTSDEWLESDPRDVALASASREIERLRERLAEVERERDALRGRWPEGWTSGDPMALRAELERTRQRADRAERDHDEAMGEVERATAEVERLRRMLATARELLRAAEQAEGRGPIERRCAMRRLTLPSADAPRERRYSLVDPVEGRAVWERCYRARWYGEGEVSHEDVEWLLTLASDWLAVVEAPTSRRACEMVRDLRRAVAERLEEVRDGE